MIKPIKSLLALALILGLVVPMVLHAATEAELQRRLELLDRLDQLDQMDLDAKLEKAEECILKRDFNCAGEHIEDAEPFVATKAQEKQMARTRQRLKREIALVQREQEEARRLARERERLEREREREREELARLEAEMQAEKERLARQANSNDNSFDPWDGVIAFSNLYIESERAKNQQRAQQIAAQKRMERDVANRLAQQQQRIAAAQRDYQQRQQAIQRQQQAQQEMERVRQQRAQQREQQRRRQLEQQRARQAEQQRQARQRELQQRQMAASNSNSKSGASARNPDEDGPQYTGRLYEPNMVTMEGSMDSGFSDRDLAIAYARLEAVRDVDDECRARGARSDAPRFPDIETGVAPTRWNYKTPDCKQGGWRDEEWYCTAEVSGTCYRER